MPSASIGARADEIWSRLRATALAAGYGATPRFQVIGDGATWIGNGAEVNFPRQMFAVDCCHALGCVAKVCECLAGAAKETQLVLAEDLALCGQEASSKVAATLQEVIRLPQGLIASLERRTER